MRIAIWHDIPSGGGFRALCGQAKALRERGHDVQIWSPESSGDAGTVAHWLPPGLAVRRIPFNPARRFRNPIDLALSTQLDQVREARLGLITHSVAASREMVQWGADVLLAHSSRTFRTTPIGKCFPGPSVLYLHEPLRHLHEAMPNNPWSFVEGREQRPIHIRLAAWVRDRRHFYQNQLHISTEIGWARHFDRILVNSLYSRESILRAYGIEPHVCRLGVESSVQIPYRPAAKIAEVVSLGELSEMKGAALAIAAIGTIAESERPPLRWYGNRAQAGYLPEMRALAAAHKVDFTFEEMLPDITIQERLESAACLLFCARLEPLGLAPLEANLAGTAVVAVAEGGVRETVIPGVNGVLVPSRDPFMLGEAIRTFTNDLSFATSTGARARAFVQMSYNWRVAGDDLEKHLAAAIDAARVRLSGGVRPKRD